MSDDDALTESGTVWAWLGWRPRFKSQDKFDSRTKQCFKRLEIETNSIDQAVLTIGEF